MNSIAGKYVSWLHEILIKSLGSAGWCKLELLLATWDRYLILQISRYWIILERFSHKIRFFKIIGYPRRKTYFINLNLLFRNTFLKRKLKEKNLPLRGFKVKKVLCEAQECPLQTRDKRRSLTFCNISCTTLWPCSSSGFEFTHQYKKTNLSDYTH